MILTCPTCRARSEFDRRVLVAPRGARCHCGADMRAAIDAYRQDEIAEMRGPVSTVPMFRATIVNEAQAMFGTIGDGGGPPAKLLN